MGATANSIGLIAVAAACGVAYVVAHERRRRYKKLHPKPEQPPAPEPAEPGTAAAGTLSAEGVSVVSVIEKDVLIATLLQTADAAYSLIEQTRRAVIMLHKEKGMSVDKARDTVSADFQSNMHLVVRAVHMKHGVTDSQIATSLKYFREDAKVTQAYAIMNAAMQGEQPPVQPATISLHRRGGKRRANRS
ncbi:hypothetical protein KFE25_010420 [Diacronema lutheri]|uniref:Uncharacterized protein n=1 Tax=Diacronema lutheri TaxID=2081491 RepID=A0A7R9YMU9_DIALT|nr:hypothetical protein KFE25_010420 [Diacronema lutheri]